jgi:hypothetical protein
VVAAWAEWAEWVSDLLDYRQSKGRGANRAFFLLPHRFAA